MFHLQYKWNNIIGFNRYIIFIITNNIEITLKYKKKLHHSFSVTIIIGIIGIRLRALGLAVCT